MDAKVFGEFIKGRRKELNLTQKDLALKVMVTDKAISRWETGIGFPDIESLEPLANALNISLYELMHSEISIVNSVSKDDADEVLNQTIKMAIRDYKKKRRLTLILSIVVAVLALIIIVLLGVSFK